jgi:hypothetical protein
MGTQNKTPGSTTQDKRHSGMAGEQAHRNPQPARGPKGKDAGNVPRSDDDVAGDSTQGSRGSSDRK